MLAVLSAAGTVVIALLLSGDDFIRVFRLSMGTAYTSLALLAATLLIGPWQVLRRSANPVSSDLRRDIGIWAAITGMAHVVFGLQVHLPGKTWQYFLWAPDQPRLIPLRYDLSGGANWTGLATALILLVLLALSNDAALRRLGTSRWKALQRWNYGGFALMVVHAGIYQFLERRTAPWIVLFAGIIAVVVWLQVKGWRVQEAERRAGARRQGAP